MGTRGCPARVPAGGLLVALLALGVRGRLPTSPLDPLGAPGAELGGSAGACPWRREAGPQRTAQDLCHVIWPREEYSDLKTAEILLETRFNVQVEVSSPPLTSAASPGPWSQSLFAFMPSWPRKTFLKAESSRTHHLSGDTSGGALKTSGSGVIFQKCALVSGHSNPQTMLVRLLVDNVKTSSSANLSDLLLLDNITGLTVRDSGGNRTADGFQAFGRKFLEAGDSYWVSYTASMDARALGTGNSLMLPAQLTFQSWSPNRTQLRAHFSITVEEKITGPEQYCGISWDVPRCWEVCLCNQTLDQYWLPVMTYPLE